jgi:hypothetical protein
MDESKIGGEPEDAVGQHSYPSPTAEEVAAQYYERMETQPGQDGENALEEAPQELATTPRAEDVDHAELRDLQREIHEPPTPQQHQSSAEELQLTAQLTQHLTQGLEPMIVDGELPMHPEFVSDVPKYEDAIQQTAYERAHEPQYHDGADAPLDKSVSSGEGESQDVNLPDQIQAELRNHDPELRHVMHQNHQPPGPPQTHIHQYATDAASMHPPAHHLAPSLSHDHLGQPQFSLADNTPPRKRTKVSRACDECRRKKIRCDAPTEAGDQPCTNCRRSSATCLFSRVPQKRGPSKG